MKNKTIEELVIDIPHGHGLSFKKGISDGLLDVKQISDIPNGHQLSYIKGKEFSKVLKEEISKKVKKWKEYYY